MFPLIEVSGPVRERGRQHGQQARARIADLQRILRDESDGYLSICRRPDPSIAPRGMHRNRYLGGNGLGPTRDARGGLCS